MLKRSRSEIQRGYPPRLRRAAMALLFTLSAILAAPLAAAPILGFAQDRVTASGVTPGARAIFFGVSHEREPWMRRVVTHTRLELDGDADGEVAFAPASAVAEISVWVAIDFADGAYAVGAPAGFELVEEEIDQRSMTGASGVVVDQRQDLALTVVRPGVAAWHGRAFDGAFGDVGAAEDGGVEVRLADLKRFWPLRGQSGSQVLDRLQEGDVVVGIDPIHLETWSFVVGPGRSGGAR